MTPETIYRKGMILLSLALFVSAQGLYAQGIGGANSTNNYVAERPTAQASSIEEAPAIDGNVLEDPVWKNIPPITELWQIQPNAGQPASTCKA